MKTTVRLVDGVCFEAVTDTGHKILMDGAVEGGGKNRGARPMALLLAGMGGCTAYDVVSMLRKGRHDVQNCEVHIEAERADDIPKVFTRIHAHYVVTGRGIRESAVKRAVELSSSKYCSATQMLAKTAEITHDYEIVEAD